MLCDEAWGGYSINLIPSVLSNKKKIINDPVFGFVTIPNDLLYDLLQHRFVQRLSRIHQLGLSSVVYPGATHTRFLHSLGALHLMQEAIAVLRGKGIEISYAESSAACAAILLHDIGHGPFSHVLEHTLVQGVSHEDISLMMMRQINQEMNGALDLAIDIFTDQYPRHFIHQMISSQLDVDRLDYLCRDSFYCGVSEGTVASARILKMLNVVDDSLVVEAKGIYSVEKFLVARRLMYWQVYLHKTSVAAEQLLIKILERAKVLVANGKELFCSPALRYFLEALSPLQGGRCHVDEEWLRNYALLDDSDIYSAIKAWSESDDKVLRILCQAFITRRIFKVAPQPPEGGEAEENLRADLTRKYMEYFGISEEEAQSFFVFFPMSTDMYSPKDDAIRIMSKDGTVQDIAQASELLNVEILSRKVVKNYLFYYKV